MVMHGSIANGCLWIYTDPDPNLCHYITFQHASGSISISALKDTDPRLSYTHAESESIFKFPAGYPAAAGAMNINELTNDDVH